MKWKNPFRFVDDEEAERRVRFAVALGTIPLLWPGDLREGPPPEANEPITGRADKIIYWCKK